MCVFAGSSLGADLSFEHAARALGRALVARGYGLVYGGASVGLMGVLANTVLEAGGRVVGVIPDFLLKHEVGHDGLTELRVVASMHERKDTMARLSDGFIALPGGIGTLEEFFEVLTWAQLGLHAKPCALLNVGGYYDSLLAFLDHAVAQRLLTPVSRSMVIEAQEPTTLLDLLETYTPPSGSKWIREERT
jgi:uncharacterized protein (TIGR00730 family)